MSERIKKKFQRLVFDVRFLASALRTAKNGMSVPLVWNKRITALQILEDFKSFLFIKLLLYV